MNIMVENGVNAMWNHELMSYQFMFSVSIVKNGDQITVFKWRK